MMYPDHNCPREYRRNLPRYDQDAEAFPWLKLAAVIAALLVVAFIVGV